MVRLADDQAPQRWPVCTRVLDERCTGIQIDPYARCLAHLSSEELDSVLSTLRPGARLDLRGTTVSPDLLHNILHRLTPRHDRDPTGPQFGDARFEQARFTGPSRFDGARFNGLTFFDGTWFEDDVSFDGARFGTDVWFGSARFAGRASFTRTEFRRRASFRAAIFTQGCSFAEAWFAQSVLFERAQFFQHASFERARFDEPVLFDGRQFHRHASFEGVQSPIESLPAPTARITGEQGPAVTTGPTDVRMIVVGADRPSEGKRAAGGFVAFILQHQPALVVVLGFLIYFMVRAAHDAFYGRFGVTPEQTGLTYILMVGRAALGLGAYLVVLAILLPLAVSLLWPLTAGGRRRGIRQHDAQAYAGNALATFGTAQTTEVDLRRKLAELRRQLAEALGRPWAVVVLILLSTAPFLLFFYWPIRGYVSSFVLLGFVGIVMALIALIVVPPVFNLIASSEARGIGLLLLLFAVLVAGGLSLSRSWGETEAQQVRSGMELSPPYRGIVGIRTRRVCLAWIAKGENEPKLRKPMMYLGAADGTTVVYDYAGNNPRPGLLRLPSTKVVIYDAGPGDGPDACPPPTTTTTSTSTTKTTKPADSGVTGSNTAPTAVAAALLVGLGVLVVMSTRARR
jgi:hypothetical protein